MPGNKLILSKELAEALGKPSVVSDCKIAELMIDEPILLPKVIEIAWKMAVSDSDDDRCGEVALQIASILCKQTELNYPNCIQTLAAANAELGDFDMAIVLQQQAIDLVEDKSPELDKAIQRLETFKSDMPIRISEPNEM